ncbi:uncharacterized protein J4E84_001240 [Alternaria hordeiaustralica]|uniref:uncharacterized protein n=1 Tax=Alternaria hordeiaustralica TaxID=1187925 RepID=UPI0020C1F191|nr:uncharacterized protein J4E84_001240 [Alternaria hordeiaustralica]KAI4698106.1 hypothetical protein J4E84_001240 [Alternaria hordeiaustralica]
MSDFNAIAQQFVQFYYKTFDENRAGLGALYKETSMLTFEAQGTQGSAAIVEKLQNLPFQQIQHRTDTVDAQPSADDGILVLVTGALLASRSHVSLHPALTNTEQLAGEDKPMSFTQAFQLKNADGNWFVLNDIFRLVYPAA